MYQKEMDSYEYGQFKRDLDDAVYGDPHQSSSERQEKLDVIRRGLNGRTGGWKDRAETELERYY